MKNPLVSIIVPTRNSSQTLEACLASIHNQTYKPIELIVVDRDSTDDTKKIAKKYTKHVYNHGPERCAQRNFGAVKATGKYLVMIDSDMELDPKVIQACVDTIESDKKIKEVVIPEESFGQGFWAQCKRLERSFYVGVSWIEAARFFTKEAYDKAGGYDETMVSGEDWDLSRRIEEQARPSGATAGQGSAIANIDEFIRHNEGRIKLWKTLRKKYYYAQHAKAYLAKNKEGSNLSAQKGPIQRYKLFLSKPGKLLKNPVLGTSMLFMKTCEFGAGALGYFGSNKKSQVLG